MKTYTTKQGDMWDIIAAKQLGSSSCVGQLIMANLSKCGYFVFPAGIKLIIPEIEIAEAVRNNPPWREVSG